MNILSLKIEKNTQWTLTTDETGNYNDFDILVESDAKSSFHFKYHDVIDVRNSKVYLQDEKGQFYHLEFLINLFVDTMDQGGVRSFCIESPQHGLLSFGNGYSDRPNALIQLVDVNSAKVLSSALSQGKVGMLA